MAAFAAWSQDNGLQTAAALNLPAGIVQLPLAIFTAHHGDWTPGHLDFRVWRAITWPIVGMVFWWIAGRGVDGLIAARTRRMAPRIGWTETIIGFLLAAGGAVFVFAFVFTAGPDRGDHDLQLLAVVAGMWASLGSVTVAARIVQWRIRKASPLEERRLGTSG